MMSDWFSFFMDYFGVEEIEHKHFTKNINHFETPTNKDTEDNSCTKMRYHKHLPLENWTKLKPKKKEKLKITF